MRAVGLIDRSGHASRPSAAAALVNRRATETARLRLKLLTLLLPIGLLAGCARPAFLAQPPQSRGAQVDQDALRQLVPGTSTERDAEALLGSPTLHASFDPNTWLYIGQVTRPVIAGTNMVLHQHVLTLTFDQRGILRQIATRRRKDALAAPMVARVTPSPGGSASLFQQLIGNIGRFGTGAGTNSTGPGSGRSSANY